MRANNPSRLYPAVHRHTSSRQGLVFVGILIAILVLAVFPATREIQRRGYAIEWWQVLPANLCNAFVAVVLTWPMWYGLDATPLAAGRVRRNGSARVALCGAYLLVSGFAARALNLAATRLFHAGPVLLLPSDLHGGDFIAQAVPGLAIVVVGHLILQRSHEQRQLIALERSLAEARLHALSLELQPHFLFNTLNGIAALIRDEPRQAERMLLGLSDLLRTTLRASPVGAIPLSRELEHLNRYLELQAMRFGPRLTIRRDIDPATLNDRVPAMLLQPLVENALTHGIAPRAGPGQLEVTTRRDGEELVLCVRDDGVGLTSEGPLRLGTGLRTTRDRLAAMFDERERLSLRSSPDGGTLVEVRLPVSRQSA